MRETQSGTGPGGRSPSSDNKRSSAVASGNAAEVVALLRRDRREAEEHFARIDPAARTELVLAANPEDRVDLILLAEDPTDLVRSLPEVELHRTVQLVGKWESQELVEVASERQINFMLDQDCWRREALDSRKAMDWFQLFMSCDDDQVFRILTAINIDLLVYVLKKHIRFKRDFMIQDTYYCDPDWVDGSNATMREFLARLYALDPALWIRLMAWVRVTARRTIEADALQAREARLAGKGFPSYSLAITVYYPVEFDVQAVVEAWRTQWDATAPPVPQTLPDAPPRSTLFLEEVLEQWIQQGVEAAPRARLESQLVEVANRVIVADQVDAGDVMRQRATIDKVRRWANLGLELAAGADATVGRQALIENGIEYHFRLGSMLFDALGNQILRIERFEHRHRGVLAGAELAPAYDALVEPEPHVPRSVNGRPQAIASLADYRYAWELTWRLETFLGISRARTRAAQGHGKEATG